jgi:hypothetical protein
MGVAGCGASGDAGTAGLDGGGTDEVSAPIDASALATAVAAVAGTAAVVGIVFIGRSTG